MVDIVELTLINGLGNLIFSNAKFIIVYEVRSSFWCRTGFGGREITRDIRGTA
jgi:hypothetical protein